MSGPPRVFQIREDLHPMDRFTPHGRFIADCDAQRIEEHDGLHRLERAALPGRHFGDHGHRANEILGLGATGRTAQMMREPAARGASLFVGLRVRDMNPPHGIAPPRKKFLTPSFSPAYLTKTAQLKLRPTGLGVFASSCLRVFVVVSSWSCLPTSDQRLSTVNFYCSTVSSTSSISTSTLSLVLLFLLRKPPSDST
jgi:hypothetical protein